MVRYRFLFHPPRWSSLALAVIEAMSVGVPIVGLATTELVTVIESGVHGFVDTNLTRLEHGMRQLISDAQLAASLGRNAQRVARERFGIERFVDDWDRTLRHVSSTGRPSRPAEAGRGA